MTKKTSKRIGEVQEATRKAYGNEVCLHAEAPQNCSSGIIRAHTIQKSGGLTKIARDGHVYGFPTDFISIHNGDLEPILIGINRASTFTGFCGFHDNRTFEPIESGAFIFNEERAFLFSYRAICNVLYIKEGNRRLVPLIKSTERRVFPSMQEPDQIEKSNMELGIEAGWRDLDFHKKKFDAALIKRDFSSVRYYVIEFEETPDFLCNGVIFPRNSFDGKSLQDRRSSNNPLDVLCFSLVTTHTGGAAVFCWIGDNQPCYQLVQSLDAMTDEQIPHAIVRFAFYHFENLFMKPEWWGNLSADEKSELRNRHWAFWERINLSIEYLRGQRLTSRFVAGESAPQ